MMRPFALLGSSFERHNWFLVRAALNSIDPTEAGFDVWDCWSKSSQKFDAADQRRTWNRFKPAGGVGRGTLFYLANASRGLGALDFDEMALAELFANIRLRRR
jgi:hypothetical protein